MGVIDWLGDVPKARASVGFHKGTVGLFIDGKPVSPMFSMSPWGPGERTQRGQRRIRAMAQTGIHLYITQQYLDLEAYTRLWPAEGTYDYRELDLNLASILANDPEAHILVKMYVQAPLWWVYAHLEEEMSYADFYSDQTSTAYCGSERGRFVSFASQAWLRDAGEMLRHLVEHLEEVPWGKRVIGLLLLNGVCQEWHYWGSIWKHLPDHSLPMHHYFRRYLQQRYPTDEALQEAWDKRNVILEFAPLPGRTQQNQAKYGFLRDPKADRHYLDYARCQQEVVREAILHFASLVKKHSDSRLLVGFYYGYVHTCPWYPDGISLETSQILASPYVDFLASPAAYEDYLSRGVGGDGLLRGLPDACRLHGKLYISESDEGTYLCPRTYHPSEAFSGFPESIANLRKQFGQLLTRRVGNWWFDLDDAYGLYLRAPHQEELRRLKAIADQALKQEHHPNPVALVYSLESLYYTRQHYSPSPYGGDPIYLYLDTLAHLLSRAGIAFDLLTDQELTLETCPNYQLYLFPNLYYTPREQRLQIQNKLRQGGVAVWMYAPGLLQEEGLDLQAAEELTGFPLQLEGESYRQRVRLLESFHEAFPDISFPGTISGLRLPANQRDFATYYREEDRLPAYGPGFCLAPTLWVGEREDICRWGVLSEDPQRCGLACTKAQGFLSVYSSCLITSTALLRAFAQLAGVPVWQDQDRVLLLGSRYICLPVGEEAGPVLLQLPYPAFVRDLISGELRRCDDCQLLLQTEPCTTYLLEYWP